MENRLTGQWSLILGSSAGMGAACALELAKAGSNIVGVHFDTASREQEVSDLIGQIASHGVKVHFINDNAVSTRNRSRIIAEIADLTGGLKVVLHSLAFGSLVSYLDVTDKQMNMTLDVMAHSLVYWVQDLHRAELLPSGARVFAMTSAGTARFTRSYGPVSAAKSALEAHVRQLAVELAPQGIAVNAIRAGITLTESFLRIPESKELSERAREGNPHGRLTTPEDVAEAVVLLANARSSWLTGNVIGIDGGEILTV